MFTTLIQHSIQGAQPQGQPQLPIRAPQTRVTGPGSQAMAKPKQPGVPEGSGNIQEILHDLKEKEPPSPLFNPNFFPFPKQQGSPWIPSTGLMFNPSKDYFLFSKGMKPKGGFPKIGQDNFPRPSFGGGGQAGQPRYPPPQETKGGITKLKIPDDPSG